MRVTSAGEGDDSDGGFEDEFVEEREGEGEGGGEREMMEQRERERERESWEDEEQRLIRMGGAGVPVGAVRIFWSGVDGSRARTVELMMTVWRDKQDGKPRPLLPALEPKYAGKKCLVLDLDETLVHSSLRVRLSFLSQFSSILHPPQH